MCLKSNIFSKIIISNFDYIRFTGLSILTVDKENMNHRKFQNHNLRKQLAFSIILDQSSKKQDLYVQILFHFISSELFSPVSYLQLAHTMSYCWNTLFCTLYALSYLILLSYLTYGSGSYYPQFTNLRKKKLRLSEKSNLLKMSP